jgi:hypothetical protein
MKVSEKSLELNVGAEILATMRSRPALRKTYLRGLIQREESQEGFDFSLELDPGTLLFAFQFKAPRGDTDTTPYRYTLSRPQHLALRSLAGRVPNSVFYVLPFYVTTDKLQQDVPVLAADTWLWALDGLRTRVVFGNNQRVTARCSAGQVQVNPEYRLQKLHELSEMRLGGVPVRIFHEWYTWYRERGRETASGRRSPWLARGLRVAVVPP